MRRFLAQALWVVALAAPMLTPTLAAASPPDLDVAEQAAGEWSGEVNAFVGHNAWTVRPELEFGLSNALGLEIQADVVNARGGATADGPARRPLLVAAAFVVAVLMVGAVAMWARTAGTEVELATSPATQQTLAILAVTEDGRLVELGPDGTEQREIYRPQAGPDAVGQLTGPIAVSETDGVVYAERAPRDRCGDEAALAGRTDVAAFPELVAIPIDGGDVRVIASAGAHPTYLPGRNWLAYVTPTNGQTCSAALDAPELEVLDLTSGDRGSHAVSAGMVGEATASGSAAVGGTPDAIVPYEGPGSSMTPAVVDLRWSSGGSSLFALVQLSRRSVPAFVDRLTFGDAVGTTTARDMTSNLGLIMPDGPMPAGSALYAETLAPYGGEDRFLVAGVVRDYSGSTPDEDIATADGRIHIYDTTLQPRDGDPMGTEVDLEIEGPTAGVALKF